MIQYLKTNGKIRIITVRHGRKSVSQDLGKSSHLGLEDLDGIVWYRKEISLESVAAENLLSFLWEKLMIMTITLCKWHPRRIYKKL